MTVNPENPEFSLRQAIAELERRHGLGETQICESLLLDFPHVRESRDSVLELIYFEFVLSQERGQPISDQELQRRFPEYQAELQKIFNVDRAFRDPHDTDRRAEATVGIDLELRPFDHVNALHDLDNFGDYELLEILGQGGMGVVYKARQRKLDRLVAVKTIDTLSSLNPTAVTRFRAEAELVAKLQHPNIVQVHEVGSQLGVPYFSMELITGGTLADATQERPLLPTTAAKILETLALAVHYAHGQSIVHRDLKPSNILLAPSDRSDAVEILVSKHLADLDNLEHTHRVEPKIADFGLAKYLAGALTHTATHSMLGTPSYMAPELIDSTLGDVGPACDIYSLGAILYDALTGRPPFHAATVIETIHQARNADIISPSKLQTNIPRDLETICLKCLHKEPSHRYASALELADDLARFRQGQPIHARPASAWEQGTKWAIRNPALASLIAVSCLAATAMAGLWLQAESSRIKAAQAMELGNRAVYAQTIRLAQFDLKQGDWQSAISRLDETNPDYRKFEWNLLRRQASKPAFMQTSSMMTNSLAFSPDGKWIAAAQRGPFGNDQVGSCRVWEIDSGREVYRFGAHPGGVNSVRFSPDGKYLATGGVVHSDTNRSGGLNVWKTSDGSLYFSDENADVYSLAFAPDGTSLATGGYKTRSIDVYSLVDRCKTKTWKGHKMFVADLAFSPDGKWLASVGRDGALRVWSMMEGVPDPKVISEEVFDDLRHVDWSKDGREIIASDFHRAIHYFVRREDGDFVQSGLTESPGINAIRVSPDGLYLATAGEGGVPLITDLETKAVLGSVNCFGHTFDIAFDKPGRRVAVATGYSIQVWDLTQCIHNSTLQFSPNPDVVAVERHPVKDQVALAYGIKLRRRSNASGEPRFEVVDIATNGLLKSMTLGEFWPTCLSFAPDGNSIASGDEGGDVHVWNAAEGTLLHKISAHDGTVLGVLAPSEQDVLISCGSDKWLRSWSMTTGNPIGQIELTDTPVRMSGSHLSNVFAIQSSTDVRVYDAATFKVIGNVPRKAAATTTIKVSDDGRWLAIADQSNAIEIWDLVGIIQKTAIEPVWTMRGHTHGIHDLAFIRDGTRLASAGTDRSVRLWDVTSGRELINLPVLGQGLNPHVVFSLDDSSLRVWDMSQRYHWTGAVLEDSHQTTSDRDWHLEQLAKSRRVNRKLQDLVAPNRFAEQFHLTRLMELEPLENWQRQRGRVRYQSGDLQGAYEDFIEVHRRLVPDFISTKGPAARRLGSVGSIAAWKNPTSAVKKSSPRWQTHPYCRRWPSALWGSSDLMITDIGASS